MYTSIKCVICKNFFPRNKTWHFPFFQHFFHFNNIYLLLQSLTLTQHSYSRHEAERLEQEAKGRLERQKISDEAEAEKARKELLELQANSAAVESTGQAKAEAQSRLEKTSDLSKVNVKLDHIMLYQVHLTISGIIM
jgi:hypothetical protein